MKMKAEKEEKRLVSREIIEMEESSFDNESLTARIHQLEKERDELHKDVEQLCMQQAGPSYLGVATRMHFQSWIRTRDRELEKKVGFLHERKSESS